MRVIIREAAYDDLDQIYAWIAKDRPWAADAVIEWILDSAEKLGRFPYMGHQGRAPGTYEWVIADSGDCGQGFRLIADSDSDRSRTAFR
jgi:toxin ParE1/3/4